MPGRERVAAHMRVAAFEAAMSYVTRSGRVDLNRLRAVWPKFVAADAPHPAARAGT